MILIEESPSIKCVGKTSLKLKFDFNQKIIDTIKLAGDAVWNAKQKFWELPLNKLSFIIDELTYIDTISIKLMEEQSSDRLKMTLNHEYEPFDYQKEGIEWLINKDNGLLLDVPGLGKTLQIIYAAEELKKQRGIEHCLIICGINTLKQNWKKEINKFSNLDCVIIGEKINSKGKVGYASVKERAEQLYNYIDEFFVIVNVESLRDNSVIDAIRNSKNNYDMIVCDEVHCMKSPTSEQGKNLLKLSQAAKYKFGLTGTVLVNSPLDAYVPLKFIGEEKGNYSNYKSFFCNYENVFGHKQITSYKNIELLKEQISNCSLRRQKDLLNLPPKTIIPEYIELDDKHAKFYDALSKGIVEEADRVNIKTGSLLGLIVRLRQASTCPELLSSLEFTNNKIERACSLAEEIISNGEKVVIFSSFKEPIRKLNEMLKKYNPLIGTGDLDDKEVSNNIDTFQNDPSRKVFIGTIQKMSTGVTLTAASYMIFLDTSWTHSEFQQACDRIHRVGTSKPVIIYDLIAKNTIDERVYDILTRKKGISDYIVDGEVNQTEDLKFLLGIC